MLFNLFRFTKTKKKEIVNAKLPGEKGFAEGSLDTSSLTWAFIRKWANEELNKTRIQNDSLIKDQIQTAALRGRIAVLKELINLPVQPAKLSQGLLYTRHGNDDTFAGY